MGRARRLRAAGLVLAALLLAACSGGSGSGAAPTPSSSRLASDCRAAVDSLLGTTQRYLAGVDSTSAPAASTTGGPTAGASSSGTSTPAGRDPAVDAQEFTTALHDIRGYAAILGCDQKVFRDDLVAGMRTLKTGGPVAHAVLLQLQSQTSGTPAPTTVAPGGDLAAAVAAAAAGATITLQPGTYELSDTLVLLRGVTLKGAGRDSTTVRSASSDGVMLVLTGDAVELDALSLVHTGNAPGSVLSAAPTATLSLSGVRVAGARSDSAGGGGVGVLMAAGAAGQTGPARRTSLRMRDSEAADDAVGGVVVAGEHRADISGLTVQGSAQCGVCFLGTSDGTLADSRLSGNAAGLVVAGDARPAVSRISVDGGQVGVQVVDRAAPAVDAATVTGSTRAAFLFAGQTTGSITGSRCSGTPYGIVVTPQAAPTVLRDDCPVARGQ